MTPVADPLRAGIVTEPQASWRQCHRYRVTLFYGSELAGKRVDVFKQAVPGLARIAVLGNGTNVTQLLWPERRLQFSR